MRRLLGEGIELVFELEPEPVPLIADRAQLEQVVMNLAINARDAMDGRGRLTIATGAMTATGSGWSSPTPARAWTPHAGADLRAVLHHQGGGQGHGPGPLDGVRDRAPERRADRGREPAGRRDDVRDLAPAQRGRADRRRAPAARSSRRGSGSVLVVEDDEAIRDLVRVVLEPAGYDVRWPRAGRRRSPAGPGPADHRHPDAGDERARARRPGPRARAGVRACCSSRATPARTSQLERRRTLPGKPFTPSELLEQVQALLEP